MSKVDDLKALREARYAAQQAQASALRRSAAAAAPPAANPVSASPAVARPASATPEEALPAPKRAGAVRSKSSGPAVEAPPAAASDPSAAAEPQVATDGLCGHRNMGNKSCQRPAGHPEKSHRYK